MRALGIDTSTSAGSVGIWGDDGLSAELNLRADATHSERLLPAVQSLLTAAGLEAGRLDFIAVARGPGSFTGLRIGIATATGLAMAAGKPLVGFPTLETMALACWESLPSRSVDAVCVLLNAGRGEVYRGVYRCVAQGAEAVESERAVAPQQAVEGLPERCVVCGDGLALLADGARARLKESARLLDRTLPIGLLLARRAISQAGSDERAASCPPLPIYLRPSDAELPRKR